MTNSEFSHGALVILCEGPYEPIAAYKTFTFAFLYLLQAYRKHENLLLGSIFLGPDVSVDGHPQSTTDDEHQRPK